MLQISEEHLTAMRDEIRSLQSTAQAYTTMRNKWAVCKNALEYFDAHMDEFVAKLERDDLTVKDLRMLQAHVILMSRGEKLPVNVGL